MSPKADVVVVQLCMRKQYSVQTAVVYLHFLSRKKKKNLF